MSNAMRQGLRASGWLLVLGLLGLLFLAWPQSLGGRVAYVRVDGRSMNPTLKMGDLAVVRRQPSYAVGDAVAYRIPAGEFGAGAIVIHRLVGGDGTRGFITKGDNRNIRDEWHPRTADIVGRVQYDLPGLGAQVAQLTRPVYLGGLMAALTVVCMLVPGRSARRPQTPTRGRHRLGGLPV
jgi:signal peptidase